MSDQSNQGDLFESPKQLVPSADLCASKHHGADTSVEAFQSTPESRRATQRKLIFALIVARGTRGATCDEVEVSLALNHQTASARLTELTALGAVSHGDDRRPTRSGKPARVHRAASTHIGGVA